MTYARLRSPVVWAGALLTGLLWAFPAPAQSDPKAKGELQRIDRAIGRVKAAVGETQENGKTEPRVEKALEHLLHALEAEREHLGRHRHREDDGTFGAGFDLAGDPTQTNNGSTSSANPVTGATTPSDGSTDNSAPTDGSTGGSPGSTASPGPTSSPITGSSQTKPNSTASTGQSKGDGSQNKQSQESHRGGHSRFAEGLKEAKREWREERQERRMARAFARGLTVLRRAELQSNGSTATAGADSRTGGTADHGSKTAGKAPSTSSSTNTTDRPVTAHRAEGLTHTQPTEPRSTTAAHNPAGGLVGQHPVMAHAPTHPPIHTGSHTSVWQHAGALAGTRTSGHKK